MMVTLFERTSLCYSFLMMMSFNCERASLSVEEQVDRGFCNTRFCQQEKREAQNKAVINSQ